MPPNIDHTVSSSWHSWPWKERSWMCAGMMRRPSCPCRLWMRVLRYSTVCDWLTWKTSSRPSRASRMVTCCVDCVGERNCTLSDMAPSAFVGYCARRKVFRAGDLRILTSITSSLKREFFECERRIGPPAVMEMPPFDKEDRFRRLPDTDAARPSCVLALEPLAAALVAAEGRTPNEWRLLSVIS